MGSSLRFSHLFCLSFTFLVFGFLSLTSPAFHLLPNQPKKPDPETEPTNKSRLPPNPPLGSTAGRPGFIYPTPLIALPPELLIKIFSHLGDLDYYFPTILTC
jgi:hypothetical protein